MILIIVISIMLLFLTGLLVFPARLILDSHRNRYFIEIPIYFRAQLVPENQLFSFKIRVFFIPIKINPFQNKKTYTMKDERKTLIKSKKRAFSGLEVLPKALSSITVRKAYADIDTGDFPLNAQLIPLTQLVNNRNINLHINFENRNTIDVEIFTRLYKLLWLGIKNKLTNTKN